MADKRMVAKGLPAVRPLATPLASVLLVFARSRGFRGINGLRPTLRAGPLHLFHVPLTG